MGEDLRARDDLVGENDRLPHFRSYEGVDLRKSQKSMPVDILVCPCPKQN